MSERDKGGEDEGREQRERGREGGKEGRIKE